MPMNTNQVVLFEESPEELVDPSEESAPEDAWVLHPSQPSGRGFPRLPAQQWRRRSIGLETWENGSVVVDAGWSNHRHEGVSFRRCSSLAECWRSVS